MSKNGLFGLMGDALDDMSAMTPEQRQSMTLSYQRQNQTYSVTNIVSMIYIDLFKLVIQPLRREKIE